MLPSFPKNISPAHKQSNIVYKYSCHRDSVCVGSTSQRLEERIQKHVPKFIRNQVKPQKDLPRRQCKSTQNASISDSDICQHMLNIKNLRGKF